jgi:hypothetical protein
MTKRVSADIQSDPMSPRFTVKWIRVPITLPVDLQRLEDAMVVLHCAADFQGHLSNEQLRGCCRAVAHVLRSYLEAFPPSPARKRGRP